MRSIRHLLLVSAFSAFAASASATDFSVLPATSNAQFSSEALLESITGTTSQLSGTISIDLASPSTVTGAVSIDASTFATGVDLRDEHLRGADWLDAAGHPAITFAVTSLTVPEGVALAHGQTVSGTASGTLSLRGVEQSVTVPVELTYYEITDPQVAGSYGFENNLLRVVSRFSVELDDFGISIPAPLQTKVSNTIELLIRVTAQQVG